MDSSQSLWILKMPERKGLFIPVMIKDFNSFLPSISVITIWRYPSSPQCQGPTHILFVYNSQSCYFAHSQRTLAHPTVNQTEASTLFQHTNYAGIWIDRNVEEEEEEKTHLLFIEKLNFLKTLFWVLLGCYNKAVQSRQLINNRYLLLLAGSSRSEGSMASFWWVFPIVHIWWKKPESFMKSHS